MDPLFNQDIIINGAPAGWAYPIAKNGSGLYYIPGVAETLAPDRQAARFRWNTLENNTATLVRPPAVVAAATEEFIEVTLANGTIIQYPKPKLTLSGTDGSIKGGTGVTIDGGVLGTIAFSSQEGDIDSAGDYLTYLNKIKTYIGNKFVVCVPLGFNYLRVKSGATSGDVQAIGYAFCIASLTADIGHATGAYAPVKLAWAFASSKWGTVVSEWQAAHPSFDLSDGDETDWDVKNAIMLPEGLDGTDMAGSILTPPAIPVISTGAFTANFQKLLNGEILLLNAA
jgi:hypothetical protein